MADRPKKSLPRWQADFPIAWDQDHYVTRRELAKFLALGSALVAGANLAIAITGKLRPERTYAAKRIGSAAALAPGQALLFRYPTDDDPCILVRTREGVLVAFSAVCTHLSCGVVYRASDDRLFCPCHNGLFECSPTGARPIEGPPERPLPQIVLAVRGDDVFATGIAS
jgi:arsenite oxidase small subunit